MTHLLNFPLIQCRCSDGPQPVNVSSRSTEFIASRGLLSPIYASDGTCSVVYHVASIQEYENFNTGTYSKLN